MSKYVVVLSVITNAILIMLVVGMLPFLLFGTAVFCTGLVWYIGRLLGQMRECVEDLARVRDVINEFGHHVESIHELEMYYGDETLGGLMGHSKACVGDLQFFIEKYAADEELVDDEEA